MSRQLRKTFIWIPRRNGLSWNFGKAFSSTSRMTMMTMMLKAKMRLRLVKGMRLAMEAVDLLLRMGGTKALVATSEATMTKAVVEPRSR